MRNRPFASVTAVRTFSIRTGLAASTVTPGSTAPDVSFTVPEIDACAEAIDGRNSSAQSRAMPSFANLRISFVSFCDVFCGPLQSQDKSGRPARDDPETNDESDTNAIKTRTRGGTERP